MFNKVSYKQEDHKVNAHEVAGQRITKKTPAHLKTAVHLQLVMDEQDLMNKAHVNFSEKKSCANIPLIKKFITVLDIQERDTEVKLRRTDDE